MVLNYDREGGGLGHFREGGGLGNVREGMILSYVREGMVLYYVRDGGGLSHVWEVALGMSGQYKGNLGHVQEVRDLRHVGEGGGQRVEER